MSEYLVGVKVNGGFPNKDYLRIEVVDASSANEAIVAVSRPARPALWVTEFSRTIPAGMAPRTVDYAPRATEESVSVGVSS